MNSKAITNIQFLTNLDTFESEPDGVKIDVDMLLMMAQAAIDAANKVLQKDPSAENKNDVKG